MLSWNVELLLCSLDLVACIMITLSCILLLVRIDLFAACGVYQSYYTCFLCGLIFSSLCVTLFWLWPMLFRHGVHLQYRCDFQLVSFYSYFEMSCPCDLYFSCCGWWVGFACDHWWLFLLLWHLCLGHMSLWFALASGGVWSFALRNFVIFCYPLEFRNWCFPSIWPG
jgi:hypothetical protein